MQLTTKLLFMFCWHVPWRECKMIRVDILSAIPVDQLQGWLGVRFFCMLCYTWLEVGVVAKKNRLVMNWHSFLGHEYGFLMLCKPLNCLKDIKKSKHFWGFASWNLTRALPQTQFMIIVTTFSLLKLNFPQTRH